MAKKESFLLVLVLVFVFVFVPNLKLSNGGPKGTELLQRRRGYDAFFGEKTTTVASVKTRKLAFLLNC